MRLVIDLIRGRAVPEADAILRFSKKRAARQIHKVLKSAVANAQQAAQRQNTPFDADQLRVKYAVVNEGQTLKRFTAAAMGRATPILKRTSHVEITWRAMRRRRRRRRRKRPRRGDERPTQGEGQGDAQKKAAAGKKKTQKKTKKASK